MRRFVPLLITVLAALALGAPGAGALTIGIADQKADMLGDLSVPWDALEVPYARQALDEWMQAAHAEGVSPLISFGHSAANRRRLPTPERFLYEFRRFRAAYPWARDFATWNEANHCGEPTCHRPELVASYFRKLRVACPKCRILGAELLDMPNMVTWVKAFRRAATVQPKYWGQHNYLDANRLRTTGTRRLSTAHAAIATRWLFDKLVPLSRRITRVYLYHWNSVRGPKTWDSALIGPTGQPRPAFRVLERELRAQGLDRLNPGGR